MIDAIPPPTALRVLMIYMFILANSDWLPPHVGGASQGGGGELSPPPTLGGGFPLGNHTWEKGKECTKLFMMSFRV